MFRIAFTLALLVISVSSVAMDAVSEAEYKANFDKCWQMLLGQDCNRNLLTQADLRRIENKYSFAPSAKSSSTKESAPAGRNSNDVRQGKTVTLSAPRNVSKSGEQTLQYFRRDEIPKNYAGDYVIIDDGNSSRAPSTTAPYSSPVSSPSRYQQSLNTVSESGSSTRLGPQDNSPIPTYQSSNAEITASPYRNDVGSASYDTNGTKPRTQTAVDSAIMGVLGGAVVCAFTFIAFWILKLIIKGGKKAAAVTVTGVNRGKEAVIAASRSGESRILEVDDAFYKQAFEEISSNSQDIGLWIKSHAIAEGSEQKQKATYIRLRAKTLQEASKRKN